MGSSLHFRQRGAPHTKQRVMVMSKRVFLSQEELYLRLLQQIQARSPAPFVLESEAMGGQGRRDWEEVGQGCDLVLYCMYYMILYGIVWYDERGLEMVKWGL